MGGEIFPDSSSALPNSAGRRPETGPSSLRSRTTGAAQIAPEADAVRDRLGYGDITVWEREGEPVSLADVTRQVAGMVWVGPVYTPPELRGYGYGTAMTAAVFRKPARQLRHFHGGWTQVVTADPGIHARGPQDGRDSLRHGVLNGARVKNRGMFDIPGGYLLEHGF